MEKNALIRPCSRATDAESENESCQLLSVICWLVNISSGEKVEKESKSASLTTFSSTAAEFRSSASQLHFNPLFRVRLDRGYWVNI